MSGVNGPNLNPVAGQVKTYNGPSEQESWEDIQITPAAFAVWVASLPTTLPATAGQAWNNNGVLCIS